MIEFHENTYCLGIWVLDSPSRDWLGAVTRDDGGPLVLRCRYRERANPDYARWWTAVFSDQTEADVIATVDALIDTLRDEGFTNAKPTKLIIRGGPQQTRAAVDASGLFTFKEADQSVLPLRN